LVVTPYAYELALSRALSKIEVIPSSSWKDSLVSGRFKTNISTYLKYLKDCYIDRRKKKIIDRDYTIKQIWSIGGETSWYYGDWLWDLEDFR
jgi:hypothetical protein